MGLEEALELGDDEMAATLRYKIGVLKAEAEEFGEDLDAPENLPATIEIAAVEPMNEETRLREEIHHRYDLDQILTAMKLDDDSEETEASRIIVENIVAILRNFHFEMETNDIETAAKSRLTLNDLHRSGELADLDLSIFDKDFAMVDSADLPEISLPNFAEAEFYEPEESFPDEIETYDIPIPEHPEPALPSIEPQPAPAKTDCPTCPKREEIDNSHSMERISENEPKIEYKIEDYPEALEVLESQAFDTETDDYKNAGVILAHIAGGLEKYHSAIENREFSEALEYRDIIEVSREKAEQLGMDISAYNEEFENLNHPEVNLLDEARPKAEEPETPIFEGSEEDSRERPMAPMACQYRLEMYDSYGDGWNGGYINLSLIHISEPTRPY